MAQRKPLVIGSNNEMEEIPSGDTLGLAHGGTGADLSTTGPGVLVQETAGAAVSVEAALAPSRGGTGETSLAASIQSLLAALGAATEGQIIRRGASSWEVADMPESGPMLTIDDETDFGTGADGAVVIAANTTLTADVMATTLSINSGVTVTLGWVAAAGRPARLYATTSIEINGTVACNGSAASGMNGGSSISGGGGGGAGSGNATGTGGSSASGSGGTGGTIGNGGSGGGGAAGRGGAGAKSYLGVGGSSSSEVGYLLPLLTTGADVNNLAAFGGGGGGGAGSSWNSSTMGGGGGGGGCAFLASPVLNGGGIISAVGGDGAPGSSTGGAGGGGGGGGAVVILCRTLSLGLSFSVAGGTAGSSTTPNSNLVEAESGEDGIMILAAEILPSDPKKWRGNSYFLQVKP